MMRRFEQILVISAGLFLQQVDHVVSVDTSTRPSSNNKNDVQKNASQQQQRSFVASFAGAGSSKSILGKLFVTRDEASLIWNSVKKTTHWEDVLLIVLAGWLIVPLVSIPYNNLAYLYDFSYKKSQHHHLEAEKTTTADGQEVQVRAIHRHKPFEQSYLYLVANNVQQIARIALVVYAFDILRMICIGMGFESCKLSAIPHAAAQTAYTLWIANRLSALKKYWIQRYVSDHPEQYGRMKIVSRLLSASLYGITTFAVLNILKVQIGAMSSFLALGSAGTLAFGLASKDITAQIMNGLMLASSNLIYEGDSVRFGNGVSGTIQKMGWMETVLRGADEITVTIPNTEVIKQRLSNLSRVRYSVVEQTLRFKYKDADNLPALATSIKEEISKACPDLVRGDGSRPFRVYWSDYAPSHLEMMVKCHFHIKPLSEEYWKNRQRVLQAIRKAVNTQEMKFASE